MTTKHEWHNKENSTRFTVGNATKSTNRRVVTAQRPMAHCISRWRFSPYFYKVKHTTLL